MRCFSLLFFTHFCSFRGRQFTAQPCLRRSRGEGRGALREFWSWGELLRASTCDPLLCTSLCLRHTVQGSSTSSAQLAPLFLLHSSRCLSLSCRLSVRRTPDTHPRGHTPATEALPLDPSSHFEQQVCTHVSSTRKWWAYWPTTILCILLRRERMRPRFKL